MEEQFRNTREQQTLQMISELSLLDDDLMSRVFDKNIEATEMVLQIILNRNDLKVLEVIGQRNYKNATVDGRSIILDIYAKDDDGKIYDIEVQRSDAGADFHRARFHSSMIDSKMLKAGQEFKEIYDSYVIFITENDMIGAGLPVYHIHRMIQETGERFIDGSYIIYVNGSYDHIDTEIGKLIHDFKCKNADEMFFSKLAKQVKYFKETEGGQNLMGQTVEKYAREYAKELAKDMAQDMAQDMAKETAVRMLKDGKLSLDEVSRYSNLSLEIIKELQRELLVLA